VTLLEADTDGVYFAVPDSWTETDERRVVAEVAALLPPLVRLEFDGRYRAMLSHEPKNYALLRYDGTLLLRGVAFRSSRAEPYGHHFLRRALARLLIGDVAGVRDEFAAIVWALRRRELPTYDVSSRVRLTKSPDAYLQVRDRRRELVYEALLAAGRKHWSAGDRVRVYRKESGDGGIVPEGEDGAPDHLASDPRDYDAEHYVRVLRETFADRISRAVTPDAFAAIVASPDQPSLFDDALATSRPVLKAMSGGPELRDRPLQ
jgi:DNA polymerase elongation subunit (family B)